MALENANSSDENVVSRVAGAYASVNDRECSPSFESRMECAAEKQ